MKKTHLILIIIFVSSFSPGSKAQFLDNAIKMIDQGKGGLTEKDAVDGIKEALVNGTGESVSIVSKLNGYFSNPEIKIPFPRRPVKLNRN